MHFAIAKCPIKFVKYFTSGLTSVQDKNPSFTNNNPDKNARVVVAKPCTILQEVEIVANGRFVMILFKIANSIKIITNGPNTLQQKSPFWQLFSLNGTDLRSFCWRSNKLELCLPASDLTIASPLEGHACPQTRFSNYLQNQKCKTCSCFD